MTAAPTTIEDPLTHSDRTTGYHAADNPAGSQFTSGRKANAVANTAKASANQCELSRGVSLGLATRNGPFREGQRAGQPDPVISVAPGGE
jgi:hypothetical protein